MLVHGYCIEVYLKCRKNTCHETHLALSNTPPTMDSVKAWQRVPPCSQTTKHLPNFSEAHEWEIVPFYFYFFFSFLFFFPFSNTNCNQEFDSLNSYNKETIPLHVMREGDIYLYILYIY